MAELYTKQLPPETPENIQAAIEESMKTYKKGRFYTSEEARAKAEE